MCNLKFVSASKGRKNQITNILKLTIMDFITGPLITFIVFAFIYKLFELFVRRRERITVIEKLGDKLDTSFVEGKLNFGVLGNKCYSFGALKMACLMVGIGLGFLIGFSICSSCIPDYYQGGYHIHDIAGIVYAASLFVFGGIGLLVAFFLEMKYSKKQ